MTELQEWAAPLLWIFSTIIALGGFVRFCKPLWLFLQTPAKTAEALTHAEDRLVKALEDLREDSKGYETHLKEVAETLKHLEDRLECNDESTRALLRTELIKAHKVLLAKPAISPNEFEAVIMMHQAYKRLGGNSFVDRLMIDITKHPIETDQHKEGNSLTGDMLQEKWRSEGKIKY